MSSLIYFDNSSYTVNNNPYTNPGWSFDGAKVIYALDKRQLWFVNLDGNDPQLLIDKICLNDPNYIGDLNYCPYKWIGKTYWLSNYEVIYSANGKIYKKDKLVRCA